MERALGEAVSFVDFKGDTLKAQGLLATPEGQTEVVRSLVETIAKVPDHIKRDFMIRAVALRFQLNENLLYTELSQILQKRTLTVHTKPPERRQEAPRERAEPVSEERESRLPVPAEDTPESKKAEEQTDYTRLLGELLIEERELIRVMLEEPKSILYMQQKFGVNIDSFISDVGKQLCTLVFRVAEQYRNIDQVIISRVTSEGSEWEQVYTMILSDILLRREMPSGRWKEFGVTLQEEPLKVIEDCLCRLLIRQKVLQQQAIEVQLKQATPELESELLREYSNLRVEIDKIRERGVPRL
jgi:DNA primase